MKTDYWDQRKL